MANVVPEVGGGAAYPDDRCPDPDSAEHVVDSMAGFRDALEAVGDGETIYIDDDATLDCSGESELRVGADNVTIASGRGRDGSDGALLTTASYPRNLFRFRADGVRLTGLRLAGPRSDYFDPREQSSDPEDYNSSAVHILGDHWEVDNCELAGWTFAAIESGARTYIVSGHAHHNYIHHCQMETLGYGAELYNGHSLLEYNHFDACRHAIAAFGHPENSYEARCNLVGPETVSHAFDMHRLEESTDHDGDEAGKFVDIHRNTVLFTEDIQGRAQEAVAIRGVPAMPCRIDRNWFAHAEAPTGAGGQGAAIRQETVEEWENVVVGPDNHYGTASTPYDVSIGCPRPTGLSRGDVEAIVAEQLRAVGERVADAFRR